MHGIRVSLLIGGFIILGACADQPTGLSTPARRAIGSSGSASVMPANPECIAGMRLSSVNVRDFGAQGDGIADDTDAIRSAVQQGYSVYFPAGRYRVRDSICLPSSTHVWGDGAALSDVVLDAGAPFTFYARGDSTGPAFGVTVERLGFSSTASGVTQSAFGVFSGTNITFRDNEAQGMGLIRTDTYHPYTDGYGNKAPLAEAELSTGIYVLRNTGRGTGTSGPGTSEAIRLSYTKNAEVRENQVSQYVSGIVWWGGDGDPGHYGAPLAQWRFAQNMLIQENVVDTVQNGIWGSLGDSIHVYSNTVRECGDVCLDAERTDNSRFWNNTAVNAAGAVMATYFFSTGVVYENNHIYQTRSWGNNWLYRLHNTAGDPASMQIIVRNNDFHYTAGTGVGIIQKESALKFYFEDNTLENTVIAGGGNNSGTASITGNTLTFNRPVPTAAISMGNNFGWDGHEMSPISDHYELNIEHNDVRSTSGTQRVQGILVRQEGGSTKIDTRIDYNEVRGFQPSIETRSTRSDHYFRIARNRVTGSIVTSGGDVTKVFNFGI